MPERPIFYFTHVLPAYRAPVMEALNERLDGRLIVCHGQPPRGSSVLSEAPAGRFRRAAVRNYWLRGETLHYQPFHSVFEHYGPPAVVLSVESPRTVNLPLLLRHARRQGAARVLWGIFYSVHRSFSAQHPLQRYRIEMARRVEACVCYTRGVRALLQPYIPGERLFVAQNTVDTPTLFRLHDTLAQEGKRAVRERLGLPPDHAVLVFMGQLVRRKGTQEVLDVFTRLRRQRPATLLVIGDGPERAGMEERVSRERMADVRFLGAMPALEHSAPYLYAADLMLIPGYVGLAVNHAFAVGLPLVTGQAPDGAPFHGPEVESIVQGKNGYLSGRSADALLDDIHRVLDRQQAFSGEALGYAHEHLTLERMVDGLESAIHYAEDRRPGRLKQVYVRAGETREAYAHPGE